MPSQQPVREKERVVPITRPFLAHIAPEGFTPLPHILMRRLLFDTFTVDEIKFLLFTARYTFGEGKKSAPIDDEDFMKAPPASDARGIDALPASFLRPLEAAGYTPIPHPTMIRLLALNSLAAMRFALCLARHTWGENKHSEGTRIAVGDKLHLSPANLETAVEELMSLGILATSTRRLAGTQIELRCHLRLEKEIEAGANPVNFSALDEALQELQEREQQTRQN